MKKLTSAVLGAVVTVCTALSSFSANAADIRVTRPPGNIIGYVGDINGNDMVDMGDLVLLSKYIKGIGEYSEEYYERSDLDGDDIVDGFDLTRLRQYLLDELPPDPIYDDVPEFIEPPIYSLYGSLPSQGDAKLAIFYVDFPDCKFSYEPSTDNIEEIAFGDENKSDKNYPFESMSAFYERSSKGIMDLDGKAFRYTAKHDKVFYENDAWKVKLIDEIMTENNSNIDFRDFDGDKDGVIDAILINVPKAAGDDQWWPCAGEYGGNSHIRYDRKSLGHVIVGNAEIVSKSDYRYFNSTYLHEMGHCMGLPDYYLYGTNDDFEGLHGSAGYALMDDATSDFISVSKLQLGWYKYDQIQIYDSEAGDEQSFTLRNAQTDEGNCLIIPYKYLDNNFQSEYLILEYTTLEANNKYVKDYYWWRQRGNGIRVLHVDATVYTDFWYKSYKYTTSNTEYTDNNAGRRFVRVIDDEEKDNLYHNNSVINNSISGFHWYDDNGQQTVDIGLELSVSKNQDGSYKITVRKV
ncbi:MAG TPA: dockerin type I domain-containing protein [Ruminococcus sp.]|nr:dockerin type I domain-containing protein [Ruminococcus sp.]